jgi:hypothetical protein
MKLSVSFKDLENHKSVDKEMTRRPETKQTFAIVRTGSGATARRISKFPQGRARAQAKSQFAYGNAARHRGQRIFAHAARRPGELESQVKKHQSRLRKDYEWKRKRPHPRISASVS